MNVARQGLDPIPPPIRPSAAPVGAHRRRRLRFRPKVGMFFAIPLVILASLLFNVAGLVSTRLQLNAQAEALRSEVARLKELREKLDREVAYRKSGEYVEDEARRYGFVRDDEVQYRFAVPGSDEGAPVKRDKKIEIHN